MNCEQIEVWISAHQDGELDPRRQRQVEDHLPTCAGCRELAAEWTALERTLRAGLVRFDAPETLHTSVMSQILEPAPAPAGRRGSWTLGGWFSFGLVPVGAAAAWMLLTGGPVTKLNPTPPPNPPATVAAATGQTAGDDSSEGPATPTPNTGGSVEAPKATDKPKSSTESRPKARPSGTSRGSRQKYDPIRGLRRLRQQRKYYPMAWNERRRRHRWQRNFQRDETLRMALNPGKQPRITPPNAGVQPKRMATLPRFTVVDYVLPQVPTTTTVADAGSETQFVLRSAQPQQVAQAGYEF